MKVARTEPCPCGSGKKYKKCCLADDEKSRRETLALREETEAESEAHRRDLATPHSPAAQSLSIGPDAEGEDHSNNRSQPRTEAEIYADQLWDRFLALDEPAPAELERILSELAALPEDEDMEWNEIFSQCAAWKSCELDKVFRQISASVPHTKNMDMAYFYWSAEEKFSKRREEYGHLHDEVVEGFCRLDVNSYSADALQPVLFSLLSADCIAGALKLSENFLPVLREDHNLMPWVVGEHCRELFELRIGQTIRNHRAASGLSAEKLAAELLCDIEEEIHADVALAAAEVVTDLDGETNDGSDWTRPAFALVTGKNTENDRSWGAGVKLFATLVRVARENWHIDAQAPEKTVLALSLLLDSAYQLKTKKQEE